jgi:ParB/RepB/Spo0J family partition protein
VSQEIRDIPLDDLIISAQNVRKDPGDLAGLTQSVADIGVQDPIHVRQVGEKYEVYDGFRRVLAARNAGHKTIPAIVEEVTEAQAALFSLIENLQRKDLTIVERVEGYKALQVLDPVYHSKHELARVTGQTHQKISQDFQVYDVRNKLSSFGIEVASHLPPSDEKRQRGEVLPEYHAVLVYQAVNALVGKGAISQDAADEEMYHLAKLIAPLPQAEAKSTIEAVKAGRTPQNSLAPQPVDSEQIPPWHVQPAEALQEEDGGQVTCACCEQAFTLIHYGDGEHQVKPHSIHWEDQQELPGLEP